ncbi:putative sugar fermentation stimulation protein (plasmid) [Selenomonas ruminantium subsp. lactilytica TAM6421]|uniref:Sugar fermentation stimulation protein homolog n=1 Tax=Selenomonas ruminantium subsp. lactilytica (strain NBRC 103574 / TAM6421) TaxID=927704 RepID=I0GW76_SELRL|nr:DNA/RNA nuclease SfsA [Selenomonas ruminantium]BAL85013.1 putative sugar fermentation stimulation protein [Selenomonas ruminantium subsp. lactilytica TAM6421]
MKYHNIKQAKFLARPNRFVAKVQVDGREETVHVKNTGRCRELLLPGVKVILSEADNPNRKTRYDLIAVEKAGLGLVNIDSQAPNKIVQEWLAGQDFDFVKPEYKYGESRIDFYMERQGQKYLLEVKGCTLELNGVGYFPDAPTERGVKHIHELIKARQEGFCCGLAFVIQMPKVKEVQANIETHSAFGEALEEAKAAGVKIIFLGCTVGMDCLTIDKSRISADF